MDNLMDLVQAFFADPRVTTIAGLILLDVMLGVAAAIKQREFAWRLLASFYLTNVLPYIVGYLAFYMSAKLIVTDLLGEFGYLVGDGMVMIAWLAIVATLASSILANAKGALGYAVQE